MKNKLHYSPEALHDLDNIWEYIVMILCNPNAAENVVNGILNTIDKLEDFAGMGAPFSTLADVANDYRFVISGNYVAFYRTVETDIYIDRILYNRRDYLRILFDDLPSETD